MKATGLRYSAMAPDTLDLARRAALALNALGGCIDPELMTMYGLVHYCYYPEHGGWGEPCAYPRSGWLNTDEPRSETEGGEGSITCMHGHQLYAAANWHVISGDGEALDLARRLATFCMLPKFWGGLSDPAGDRTGLPGHIAAMRPDPPFVSGSEQGHWYSHFHARAITLRGILEYGRLARDERAMEFARRAWEFTLGQGIARMGWINCYPGASNSSEGCALGDLVALGIRLSDAGLGDYWDDVDAVVRNQLVEGQLGRADELERISAQFAEPCGCEKNAHPGQISCDDTIARTLGSFAGHSLPTGIPKPFVMHCCTSNASQGLYYAWEGALREEGDAAQVNLLLHRAGRLVDVDSFLPWEGKVVVRNKSARRVSVRIPWWVARGDVRAEVSGRAKQGTLPYCLTARRVLRTIGERPLFCNRVVFDGLRPGDAIAITFPVKESTERYTVNAHTPAEQVYTCVFRGSTLVDISPRDATPTSYRIYQRDHLRRPPPPLNTIERFLPDRIVRGW